MSQENDVVEEFWSRLRKRPPSVTKLVEWIEGLSKEDQQLIAVGCKDFNMAIALTWQCVVDLFVDSAEQIVEAAGQATAALKQWTREVHQAPGELQEDEP